jgi:hypothetical protein
VESLENLLKEKTMVIGQAINFKTAFGMRVDVVINQIQEDKPLLFVYTYSLDVIKFKTWLESKEIAPLCEGPLAFTSKGIQFMIVGGAEKWDKTAFSIDDADGEKIFLQLTQESAVFHVHRDLFAGKEWEVLLAMDEREAPF